MWCWGAGKTGDLLKPHPLPHKIDIGEPVVSLAALSGNGAFCAITESGKSKCWSDEGPDASRVPLPEDLADFTSSSRDACALLRSGRALCLENEKWVEKHAAARALFDAGDHELVGSGSAPTCVITKAATIDCWTDRRPRYTVPGLSNVVQLNLPSSGPALAVDAEGKTWSFDPAPVDPMRVLPAPKPKLNEEIGTVAQLAAGYDRACVLRKDGSVWCGGRGDSGELGNRHRGSVNRLEKVEGVPPATQISVGDGFTCAQTARGETWCWGARAGGNMGDGFPRVQIPGARVAGVSDATSVVTASDESCALRRNGEVVCWGGQVRSYTDAAPPDRATARPIEGLKAKRLFSSGYGICALEESGSLACFADGLPRRPISRYSALGDVSAVAIRKGVSLALRADGQVVLFETATEGASVTATPYKHPALRDVTALVMVDLQVGCVQHKSGKLNCFHLSIEDDVQPQTAVGKLLLVAGAEGATMLSGGTSVCFKAKNGEVSCLDYGSLRLAVWPQKPTPPNPPKDAIADLPKLELLPVEYAKDALGYAYGCAITAAGRVECETKTPRKKPTVDCGLQDIVALAVSSQRACALDKTGQVHCWGINDKDQLGGAESPFAFVPVKVPIPGL